MWCSDSQTSTVESKGGPNGIVIFFKAMTMPFKLLTRSCGELSAPEWNRVGEQHPTLGSGEVGPRAQAALCPLWAPGCRTHSLVPGPSLCALRVVQRGWCRPRRTRSAVTRQNLLGRICSELEMEFLYLYSGTYYIHLVYSRQYIWRYRYKRTPV